MNKNIKSFPQEAIVLAGGKGTRLKNVIKDIPKPMAIVNGKPFLWYVLSFLSKQGIHHVVLSVGYKADVIINYFGDKFDNIQISYAVENEALGTGGGIKFASRFVKNQEFWVINGDTFFEINLNKFFDKCKGNKISLALAEMKDFDRYGVVKTDNKKIIAFREKQYQKHGFINAGIYLLNKKFIKDFSPDIEVFSFEKDILEKLIDKINIGFFKSASLFIDIGIPTDYYQSQFIFSNNLNKEKLFSLNPEWTIFLDRDGVINHRRPGSYVKSIQDFEFIDGVKKAIKRLSLHFNKLIVVTNQQGLGKGKMSIKELNTVNKYMVDEIKKAGGRIDGVYFCPQLATQKPNCRKPEPDLAYNAKKDFPEIDFKKSVIFGDSISDMQFGKNLGMKTVLLPTKKEEFCKYPEIEVDWRITELSSIL